MTRSNRVASRNTLSEEPTKFIVWLLVAFMVVEYARPLLIAELKVQLIIIVVFAILMLGKLQQIRSGVLLAQVIFLLLLLKSMPFAVNSFSVYATIRVTFGIVVISAVIVWIVQYRKYATLFMQTLILVLTYCGIYGLLHGGRGPGGFIGDENDLALGCSVGLSFSLFGAIHKSGKARITYLILSAILISGIVISMSRGGFLAAFAVVGFVFISMKGALRKLIWPVIGILLFVLLAPEEYKMEILSISEETQVTEDEFSTGLQRQYLWATATNMFLDRPILGVGAGNFPWNVAEYQPTSGNWPEAFLYQSRAGSAVHSTYFELIAEVALPGLLVVLYLLKKTFSHLSSLRSWSQGIKEKVAREDLLIMSYGLTGALLGYLVGAVFLSTLYYPYLWYLSAMAAGLYLLKQRAENSANTEGQ